VYSGPQAGFVSSSPDWLGQTTTFTNTTLASGPTDYVWSFGDGATSTLPNPSHAYASAGRHTVVLTATSAGESDVVSGTVVVYGSPVVDFTASPTQGVAPLDVTFTSAVTTMPPGDPTLVYEWDFGDGGTSSQNDPLHTYATPGAYTVTLQVSNAAGSDVETKEQYITVEEGPTTHHAYLPLVLHE
jgi:PKD repeat protein